MLEKAQICLVFSFLKKGAYIFETRRREVVEMVKGVYEMGIEIV